MNGIQRISNSDHRKQKILSNENKDDEKVNVPVSNQVVPKRTKFNETKRFAVVSDKKTSKTNVEFLGRSRTNLAIQYLPLNYQLKKDSLSTI